MGEARGRGTTSHGGRGLRRAALVVSVAALVAVALAAWALLRPAPDVGRELEGREEAEAAPAASPEEPGPEELREGLGIVEDYRPSLSHGEKGPEHQRYIVLHDTEVDAKPQAIVSSWDASGNGVAAHFVVGRDGTVVQCVPLDEIAHHAGYGDTGHNELYGIEEDGRDDMAGTVPVGEWASDYGMNAWSVGIEMVHVGGAMDYTPEQLEALDGLIAYIDAYYGFESDIIDHKAWRSGNSDTSPEFAGYLESYRTTRTHDGEAA